MLPSTLIRFEKIRSNRYITQNQYGFLAGKSNGLQLISFYKHIYKSRDASSLSYIVYINLEKAFDKISHTKLLHKLSHYGICGDVIMWHPHKQRVQINKTFSNYTQVISGVPQGSVIGPLLFLIYINYLSNIINNSINYFLFADDTKLSF